MKSSLLGPGVPTHKGPQAAWRQQNNLYLTPKGCQLRVAPREPSALGRGDSQGHGGLEVHARASPELDQPVLTQQGSQGFGTG